jgi:YVTN family beta-propeller protein
MSPAQSILGAAAIAAIVLGSLALAAQYNVPPSTGLISLHAIAFNPAANKFYAVDPGQHAVAVVDAAGHSRRSVPVGDDPLAIAVNPVTNRVYVVNTGSGTVTVLDGKTDAVMATVDVGKRPYALAVDAVDDKVYVSNTFSDLLTIIDGATNATRTVKTGSADLIVAGPKQKIYLLGYESSSLTVLDNGNDAISRMSAGAMHLWAMALDETGSTVYVTRISNGDLAAIDVPSHKITPIAAGQLPCAVAVNAKTSMVYVANCGDDTVTVMDEATQKPVVNIPVGKHPQAIAVDPKSDLIYVANTHGDSVTVIDGAHNRVMATVPGGKNPYAIAVAPMSGLVYVANLGEPSYTQINLSCCLHR